MDPIEIRRMRQWKGVNRSMLRESVFALSSEPVMSSDKAAAVDLIARCLKRKSSERISSMDQVLQHRFFGHNDQNASRVLVVSCPQFGSSPDTGQFNFPVRQPTHCHVLYFYSKLLSPSNSIQVMDRMNVLNQETDGLVIVAFDWVPSH